MVNANEMSQEILASLTFTEDEKSALRQAQTMPIVFDEDCPETTPERALNFRRVNPPRDKIYKRA